MALKKKLIQDDGVTTEYHRILYVQSTVNSHCSVAVISLVSEEIRDKQLAGEIQQPYQKIVTYETTEYDDFAGRKEQLRITPCRRCARIGKTAKGDGLLFP